MPEELSARRLKTFFVGTETSRNPMLPRLQALGKQLAEGGLCEGPGVLSARYGKRVLITTGGAALASLGDKDFVEIVDFDPQRNRCLLLGKAEPTPDAGVHWLIYANREEANAILHLHDPLILEVQEATQMFPESREIKPAGNVELAVEALKLMRKGPFFVLRNHGCFAVGKTVEDALAVASRAHAQAVEVVEEAEGLDDGDAPPEPPPGPPRRR